MTERRVSFTMLDEAVLHLEQHGAPWNVQLEVGAAERLDTERIADAISAACAVHPMLRARRDAFRDRDRRYRWIIPDRSDELPLEETEVADEAELTRFRSRFHSPAIDLDRGLPWRAAVIHRGDEGDLLALCVSHVAADGVGTVRFARAIAAGYAGAEPEPPVVDLDTARDLPRQIGPDDMSEWGERIDEASRRLIDLVDAPARIAVDGGRDEDGFGFVHRALGPQVLEPLLEQRPEGASVNDLLLAALHLTIGEWNDDHDEETDRIPVMMPVNARPDDWRWDVVSNYAPLSTVSTGPDDRTDAASAIRAVCEQTTRLKSSDRASHLFDLLQLISPLPLGVKRRMPGLLDATRDRFIDSAVLSNLGLVPQMPSFEDPSQPPPELWFSPPCRMPLGVAVGAATVNDTLFLVVRYRFEQFGEQAGERFADRFVETVTSISR